MEQTMPENSICLTCDGFRPGKDKGYCKYVRIDIYYWAEQASPRRTCRGWRGD